MTMFLIGLFIGVNLGVVLACLWAHYRHPSDDECNGCMAAQRRVVSQLEDTINGLKSTQGKLGSKLNAMAFRNSGFNAR